MKKISFIILFAVTLLGSLRGQSTAIEQARSSGMTDQQIQSAIASQQQSSGGGTVTQPRSEQEKINQTLNPEIQRVSPDKADVIEVPQKRTRPPFRVFGQDIFNSENLSFTPNYNMATPKNYVLAAGDEIILEVWGTSQLVSRLKISPEGSIYIDKVGSIVLNGYSIEEAERKIKERLSSILGGIDSETYVKIALGELRSIKVNIVGEVMVPGTYTLPSLATLFNALYMAGGVNNLGSLRNIEVYRDNRRITTFDAYDFLVNGKYDSNIRLEDNDIIIVPTYKSLVRISGAVKRQQAFELRQNETLANLLEYAGGFRGKAFTDNVLIRRRTGKLYQLFTVEQKDFSSFVMHDGDEVRVDEILDRYENRVSIHGAVWRPGDYEFSSQTNTLSKLIAQAENLKGNEFASRGQITRERKDFTHEIIPFDIREIINGETDIQLQPEDVVYIPTIERMVEDYFIVVKGAVNEPATLPFRYNMTIEDAIILAGGLKESASLSNIEVARRIKDPRAQTYNNTIAQTFTFPISESLSLDFSTSGFILQPFDEVYIRRSPIYKPQQSVQIEGEVIFGGDYVLISSAERLTDVVQRAGGVTLDAYIKGASLIRQVSDDERMKIKTKLDISEHGFGEKDTLHSLDIFNEYIVGIDLEKALMNPGGNDDIVLRDGDVIHIPKINNTVKISGAVLHANSVTYDGKNMKEYISQAGGFKDNARKRPFVIYMNGKIASTKKGFLYKRYPKIEPGCEIVVPEKNMRNRMTLPEIINLTTSTTAIAAMVATMAK